MSLCDAHHRRGPPRGARPRLLPIRNLTFGTVRNDDCPSGPRILGYVPVMSRVCSPVRMPPTRRGFPGKRNLSLDSGHRNPARTPLRRGTFGRWTRSPPCACGTRRPSLPRGDAVSALSLSVSEARRPELEIKLRLRRQETVEEEENRPAYWGNAAISAIW